MDLSPIYQAVLIMAVAILRVFLHKLFSIHIPISYKSQHFVSLVVARYTEYEGAAL